MRAFGFGVSAIIVAGLCFTGAAFARGKKKDAGPKPNEYVYKTVDDIKIHADVYQFDDDTVRPVVVWFHGGALIQGSRKGINKDLLAHCRTKGYVLVSFSYRLAPEVKLPAILEDVKDSIKWVRENGPELFHVDPAKLVVSGGSAGGYLTLLTGHSVEPKPLGLISYWGYGDIAGDWYTKPDAYYSKQKPRDEAKVRKGVGKKIHTDVTWRTGGKTRGQFYIFCRQKGLWTNEVTGFDPKTEDEKLTPYCPVRNVTKDYPPTFFLHGEADEDVPFEQSKIMAEELKKKGVRHELFPVPKGNHGIRKGDAEAIKTGRQKALDFLDKLFGTQQNGEAGEEKENKKEPEKKTE